MWNEAALLRLNKFAEMSELEFYEKYLENACGNQTKIQTQNYLKFFQLILFAVLHIIRVGKSLLFNQQIAKEYSLWQ